MSTERTPQDRIVNVYVDARKKAKHCVSVYQPALHRATVERFHNLQDAQAYAAGAAADGHVARADNFTDAMDRFEAAVQAGVDVKAMLAAQAARTGAAA